MSFFVNASEEEAFRLVMDYFEGRRMKILTSNAPSYIRAQFGSWVSMSPSNSKGEVEINTVKRNGGSYVNLNFDFSKEYLAALIVTTIGAIVTLIVYGVLEIEPWFTLVVILAIVAIVGGIVGYSVSATRRSVIEEFNMFIQSFASKKD